MPKPKDKPVKESRRTEVANKIMEATDMKNSQLQCLLKCLDLDENWEAQRKYYYNHKPKILAKLKEKNELKKEEFEVLKDDVNISNERLQRVTETKDQLKSDLKRKESELAKLKSEKKIVEQLGKRVAKVASDIKSEISSTRSAVQSSISLSDDEKSEISSALSSIEEEVAIDITECQKQLALAREQLKIAKEQQSRCEEELKNLEEKPVGNRSRELLTGKMQERSAEKKLDKPDYSDPDQSVGYLFGKYKFEEQDKPYMAAAIKRWNKNTPVLIHLNEKDKSSAYYAQIVRTFDFIKQVRNILSKKGTNPKSAKNFINVTKKRLDPINWSQQQIDLALVYYDKFAEEHKQLISKSKAQSDRLSSTAPSSVSSKSKSTKSSSSRSKSTISGSTSDVKSSKPSSRSKSSKSSSSGLKTIISGSTSDVKSSRSGSTKKSKSTKSSVSARSSVSQAKSNYSYGSLTI